MFVHTVVRGIFFTWDSWDNGQHMFAVFFDADTYYLPHDDRTCVLRKKNILPTLEGAYYMTLMGWRSLRRQHVGQRDRARPANPLRRRRLRNNILLDKKRTTNPRFAANGADDVPERMPDCRGCGRVGVQDKGSLRWMSALREWASPTRLFPYRSSFLKVSVFAVLPERPNAPHRVQR